MSTCFPLIFVYVNWIIGCQVKLSCISFLFLKRERLDGGSRELTEKKEEQEIDKRERERESLVDLAKVNTGRLGLYVPKGGRNSSVGSAWARCPQCHGFDPPLGTFSGGGDFSLGVNMGSNSIPPKTPSDESINRGLVCAHMHFIAWTQKILTFMS